jgi:putative GTP pyrophosphokinase
MAIEQSVLIIPDKARLRAEYEAARPGYEKALGQFIGQAQSILSGSGLRPTLKGRVKSFESYYSKRLRLLKAAWNDRRQTLPVNDVLAIRVVFPFLGDLAVAERVLSHHFPIVEIERKGSERSFKEFGYESIHVLVPIPDDLKPLCPGLEREVIEIQLRTILQEAWAEVEHLLVYKAEFTPFDEPMKRKLAALNANLTLSDIIFQEILEFEKRLTSELDNRREAFYRKIEEVAGDIAEGREEPGPEHEMEETVLPGGSPEPGLAEAVSLPGAEIANYGNFGMDGLLLSALEAHNKADFERAVLIYGQIIEQKPGKEIASVVFKHRGMAYFAQSKYLEAMEDFSSCLVLDPECYKAFYYRGVVKGVLQDCLGAVEDFSSALALHPYHFFSRYRRAHCHFSLGDIAAAHADCEIALRIEPDNALARHLFRQIKEKLAMQDF